MEIKKEKLEQIINQSANPSRLEPEQIPELELYIDQILMLFEDKLGENRRRENDKILTKSMVNNYSKEKMIRPMRGKKYKIKISRDRISPDAVPAYFLLHNQKREDIMYEYAHIVTDTEGEIKRLSAKKGFILLKTSNYAKGDF